MDNLTFLNLIGVFSNRSTVNFFKYIISIHIEPYLFLPVSSVGEGSADSFFSLLLSLFFPEGVLDFLSFGDLDRLDLGLSPDLGDFGVLGGSSGAGVDAAVSLGALSGDSGLSTGSYKCYIYCESGLFTGSYKCYIY